MARGKKQRLVRRRRNPGECSTSVESSSRASRDMQCPAGSAGESSSSKYKPYFDTSKHGDSGDSSFEDDYISGRRAVEYEDVATSEAELEAYCNGSWWDATVLKKDSDRYFVHYEKFDEDQDEWVPLGHLRLRSRIAVMADCQNVLDPGVDVCLMSHHPHSDHSHPAWYDAKIIDIERKPHTPWSCKCLFDIRLYTIPDTLPSDYKQRRLLPIYPNKMRLSSISIIRTANNMSFHQLVGAALPHVSSGVKRRWAVDGKFWYSSFLEATTTVKDHSSLESRVAGGSEVPTTTLGHLEESTPKVVELMPFDAFLEEEGLMDDDLNLTPERKFEEEGFIDDDLNLTPESKPEEEGFMDDDLNLSPERKPEEEGFMDDDLNLTPERKPEEEGFMDDDLNLTPERKPEEEGFMDDDLNVTPERNPEAGCLVDDDLNLIPERKPEEEGLVDDDLNSVPERKSKEEGLVDDDLNLIPEREPEQDVIPVFVHSSPVQVPIDHAKVDPAVSGSKTQPILLDLDNDTDSADTSDKEDTSFPVFRFLDRFPSEERATSPESVEDDVGEAPADIGTSSEISESHSDELEDIILSELNTSNYSGPRHLPAKSVSLVRDKSASLTAEKSAAIISKSVGPSISSESSDLDDFVGYLERNIEVNTLPNRAVPSTKAKSTSKFPAPGPQQCTGAKPRFAQKLFSKGNSRVVPKQFPVIATPQKALHSASEEIDKLDSGLEDFADELQSVLVTEGPVVRELLTQKKEETKAGHLGQSFGRKPKRPRNGGNIGEVKRVKEVTYADLFKTVQDNPKIPPAQNYINTGACLSPSWNPLMESWGLESQQEVQEDSNLDDVWEDMRLALEIEGITEASKVAEKGGEKSAAAVGESNKCINPDGSTSEEDHVFEFSPEVGLVCEICGIVGLEIENMWERDNAKRIATTKVGNSEENGSEHDGLHWDSDEENNIRQKSPKGGSIFELIPDLEKHLQEHQREGFRFLWRNLAGVDPGGNPCVPPMEPGGCVLSHAPGTGKSLLIICFLQSYMKVNPQCRPLIVAPKIMLKPWEKEFRKWNVNIPVFNLNQACEVGRQLFQQHEESGDVLLKCGGKISTKRLRTFHRQAILWEWTKTPSVLVISYAMYSGLTYQSSTCDEKSQIRKLLQVRPNILILDEGHYVRNKDSIIRRQLMTVKTPLRIMLSGTLFQNNFEELFTSLNLVRTGFVKTFAKSAGLNYNLPEYEPSRDLDKGMGISAALEKAAKAEETYARKLFIEEIGSKIDKGQKSQGLTESLTQGLEQLHRLTSPFVNHYTGAVLKNLPPLRDFSILLKPTDLQEKMLQKLTKILVGKSMLEQECLLSLVSIHPYLFSTHTIGKLMSDLLSPQEMMEVATNQDPHVGVKTRFIIGLLKLLKAGSEKVLVFSQNLDPLLLLERMLNKEFGWVREREFLQLDGKVPMNERQKIIQSYNDPEGRVRVLLASTKACGEGITLTGASRVIFMDVLWNPAVIRQAIHRAFRIGQTKIVHVYRLISSGTFEEAKYRKMVWKDWKSQAIFNISAENSEQVKNKVKESRGAPQHCFWEIMDKDKVKLHTKDILLKELFRQDITSDLPAFRHVFRHGGLFDEDYSNEPEDKGEDATDWLRGGAGADSIDLDAYDFGADADNDDCDNLEEEDLMIQPPPSCRTSLSAFEKAFRLQI